MVETLPPDGLSDRSDDGPNIDSTPIIPRPPTAFVESASCSIPTIIADVRPTHAGTVEIIASHLVNQLRDAGHTIAASQWAVHEAILGGRLKPTVLEIQTPTIGRRVGGKTRSIGRRGDRRIEWSGGEKWSVAIPLGKPAPFECFKVIATEQLWEWWRILSETAPVLSPASDSTPQASAMAYPAIKSLLCEFMETRFLDRTSIGAVSNFMPSELLSTEHGFTDADKRHLIRAFEELRMDGVIDFGMVEMPTSEKTYDPWFNGRRRLTILSKVLKLASEDPSIVEYANALRIRSEEQTGFDQRITLQAKTDATVRSLEEFIFRWSNGISAIAGSAEHDGHHNPVQGWDKDLVNPDAAFLDAIVNQLCRVGEQFNLSGEAIFIDAIQRGEDLQFEQARLLVRDAIFGGPSMVRQRILNLFSVAQKHGIGAIRNVLTSSLLYPDGVLKSLTRAVRSSVSSGETPNVVTEAKILRTESESDHGGIDKKADETAVMYLVTRLQIADVVHLESKSMTPHTKIWGTPVVPHSGKRPAKWDLNKILPTLKNQFTSVSDASWKKLRDAAEQV